MIRRKKIVTINAIRIVVWKNVLTFNLALYLTQVGKSTPHFFQRPEVKIFANFVIPQKMSCEQIPLTMYPQKCNCMQASDQAEPRKVWAKHLPP